VDCDAAGIQDDAMSDSIVRDRIVEELALLERVARTPDAEGYGVDLICIDDLDPKLAETDPSSVFSLAQDLYHRAIENRGAVIDDPDAGEHILSWLSQGTTNQELANRAGTLAAEFRKDDRVADVTIEVELDNTKTLTVRAIVTPADPDQQEFTLIMSVTDGKALLQEILES
jgi:hypothetical protein